LCAQLMLHEIIGDHSFLQQQERFDGFMEIYNNDRPHQALGGLYPAEVYTPSAREFHPPAHPRSILFMIERYG